ncbi:DUF5131 family protein, partial [Succinivibrio dextrinosolvens]
MHDIWNPWHGCIKISEGCKNCYMFWFIRESVESPDLNIIKFIRAFFY